MNEKEKIEQVMMVFQDYLKAAPEIEVLWSEKKQFYLFMQWDQDETMQIFESAEKLTDLLFNEIYMDVYMKHELHKIHIANDWSLTPEAKTEFLNLVQPYLVQLPEYEYLVQKLLNE